MLPFSIQSPLFDRFQFWYRTSAVKTTFSQSSLNRRDDVGCQNRVVIKISTQLEEQRKLGAFQCNRDSEKVVKLYCSFDN